MLKPWLVRSCNNLINETDFKPGRHPKIKTCGIFVLPPLQMCLCGDVHGVYGFLACTELPHLKLELGRSGRKSDG